MTTIEIKPPINIQGWADFAGADTLSQLIWDGLSEAGRAWHYMNFTSDMSIWESTKDASTITMIYKDEHLAQLMVTPGIAYDYLLPLIKKFQLTALP